MKEHRNVGYGGERIGGIKESGWGDRGMKESGEVDREKRIGGIQESGWGERNEGVQESG